VFHLVPLLRKDQDYLEDHRNLLALVLHLVLSIQAVPLVQETLVDLEDQLDQLDQVVH